MTANFKRKPIRDRKYLDSFRGETCLNCGVSDETVVGAHIRWGNEGGTGYKPSDDLTLPLCFKCHKSFDADHSSIWLAVMVKNMARRRYQEWLTAQARSG